MTVTVDPVPASRLTEAEIAPWRPVPVAVAVDLSHESQIDPAIRPLNPPGRQPRLFGRAVTALCEPPDFGAVIHAIALIGPGDVLVIAAGGDRVTAMIGEIIGGHLRDRGCAGVVCDGAVRDVATLSGLAGYPIYARSITPRGPISAERGAVNRPVVVGGRLVTPGDLVIGDDDGLAALSPATVRARLGDAQARLRREARWVEDLASGRPALDTFGLATPAAPSTSAGAVRRPSRRKA
jgi:regulator of RNase E activity RraA